MLDIRKLMYSQSQVSHNAISRVPFQMDQMKLYLQVASRCPLDRCGRRWTVGICFTIHVQMGCKTSDAEPTPRQLSHSRMTLIPFVLASTFLRSSNGKDDNDNYNSTE